MTSKFSIIFMNNIEIKSHMCILKIDWTVIKNLFLIIVVWWNFEFFCLKIFRIKGIYILVYKIPYIKFILGWIRLEGVRLYAPRLSMESFLVLSASSFRLWIVSKWILLSSYSTDISSLSLSFSSSSSSSFSYDTLLI